MSDITKISHESWRSDWLAGAAFPSRRARPMLGARAVPPVLIVADVVAILLSGLAASAAYLSLYPWAYVSLDEMAGLTALAAILFPAFGHGRDLYAVNGWRNVRRQVRTAILVWLFVFAILAVMLFVLKAGALVSRGATLSLFLAGGMSIVGLRYLSARLLSAAISRGMVAEVRLGVLAIGSDSCLDMVGSQEWGHGRQVVCAWRVASLDSDTQASAVGRQISREISSHKVDRLLIVAATNQLDRTHLVSDQLRLAPIAVSIMIDRKLKWVSGGPVMRFGDRVAVEVSREPLGLFERILKRSLDLALALPVLLLLSPFLVLVALVIRLDSPGRVIFRQRRDGFGNKPFYIYKFRSMHVMEDGPEIAQARRGDDRITRVGRFIRRTSIDELPQLWNVVRGEMSIVGPRPHAVAHGEHYSGIIPDYSQRHHVKPGLTGWAQVNGCRGETREIESMARRIEHDLWYISHWSLWLDVKIIVKTAWLVLRGKDAF